MERRKEEDSSLYRDCKLFLSKDGLKVVRVDCGIVSIPLFRIDVKINVKIVDGGLCFYFLFLEFYFSFSFLFIFYF